MLTSIITAVFYSIPLIALCVAFYVAKKAQLQGRLTQRWIILLTAVLISFQVMVMAGLLAYLTIITLSAWHTIGENAPLVFGGLCGQYAVMFLVGVPLLVLVLSFVFLQKKETSQK